MGASASSSGERRRRCGSAAIVADTVSEHFDLTIDGYSHIKAMLPTGKCATSPPFTAGGHEWCVDFYPNGKLAAAGDADMIQFFLRLRRAAKAKAAAAAVVAQVRFDLLGDGGVLSFAVDGRGQSMVIRRDAFEQAGCAKDDRFTVRFAVTVFRGAARRRRRRRAGPAARRRRRRRPASRCAATRVRSTVKQGTCGLRRRDLRARPMAAVKCNDLVVQLRGQRVCSQ